MSLERGTPWVWSRDWEESIPVWPVTLHQPSRKRIRVMCACQNRTHPLPARRCAHPLLQACGPESCASGRLVSSRRHARGSSASPQRGEATAGQEWDLMQQEADFATKCDVIPTASWRNCLGSGAKVIESLNSRRCQPPWYGLCSLCRR